MAKTLDEITYVSLPITKFEEDDDGNLVVYGKATDGSLDSDRQVVDPSWSAKAMADWHESGGNVRVMHNPGLYPAGRSLALETTSDGHWVKSLVAEPTAQRLVRHKVLRAYSIGIAEPQIDRDMTGKAPGGIIRGGRIVELSLVDRPANKNCGLVLAKSEDNSANWSYGDLEGLLAKAEAAESADKAEEEPGEVAHDPDKPNQAGAGEEVDESDVVKADTDANVADGDDVNGSGDSHNSDATVGDEDGDAGDADGGEAVKIAGTVYRAARKQWLDREPSVVGIAGGTEYLAKRVAWQKWNAEGEAEGLDGTREGATLWLAKRADDELTVKGAEEEAAYLTAEADSIKRDFSADQRRQLAKEGKALSDGSYPIPDADALRRAAVLARSGHGNVKAARRLISRRAKGLGVPNPLEGDDKVKKTDVAEDGALASAGAANKDLGDDPFGLRKADSDGPPMKDCKTCKGSGKIRGGNMDCPSCDGKGKMPKGGKAKKAAATAAAVEAITKAFAAGVISQKAAEDLLHQVVPEGGFLHQSDRRPLPSDVAAVAHHREPDGTTGVEMLEHDAGLPTDADPVADNIPASVAALQMKSDAPYAVARMHDAVCAAWSGEAVLGDYPSLKSVADAVDPAWFTARAGEATVKGDADAAGELTAVANAAAALKAMDAAVVADGRAELAKSFSDMYPSDKVRPSDPRGRGTFTRPYITAGHQANSPAVTGHQTPVAAPPSSDVPEPQEFHRGYLAEGHAAPSPADHGPNNPVSPTTGSARTYYTNSAREQARLAMQAVHDHIAATHPELCPMAPSKAVMPPDLGARNVPAASPVGSMGGLSVGKAASNTTEGEMERQNSEAFTKPKKKKTTGLSKAEVIAEAARLGLTLAEPAIAPVPVAPDAVTIKALVAEQLTPMAERYEKTIAELRDQVDKLGRQPDPALAPVRGQMARPGGDGAAPVEKRSLIDEARTREAAVQARERADFAAYMEMQARSSDPKTREKAMDVLDKMASASTAA